MKHRIVSVSAVVLGAALMAAGASADLGSVHDPRGDTKCSRVSRQPGLGHKPCSDSTRRNADIVRATAGREGTWLRHTIRVVGKFQSGWLTLNTDSHGAPEWGLDIERGERNILPQGGPGTPAEPDGRVKVEFHRHSVEVFFRESQIGNPPGYGWRAGAAASGSPLRGWARDDVPHGRNRYIRHELG